MSKLKSLRVVGSALLLGFAMPALAQHENHGQVGHVPVSILEKPVALRAGVGNAHEKVSTTSAEAQAFYDQGINYLHSYVWIEAARSFHQALRHDANLAMAWVGLSRAYAGIDDNQNAQEALNRAKALSAQAAPWEQTRIALRQTQLDAIGAPGNIGMFHNYKRDLDAALAKRMDDIELWLLRGNAEEPLPSGRGQRGGASSIAFYKQAVALQPNHSAAHHYLVHSYETIGQIKPALASGEIYANAANSVPHAWHMWGHDLRRDAQVEKAIEVFSKAEQIEEDYYKAEGISSKYDWHHVHNLDLLAGSYQYMGRIDKAAELFGRLAAIDAVEGREYVGKSLAIRFYLTRGMWDKAEKGAQVLLKSSLPEIQSAGHLYIGQAQLGRGNKAKAVAATDTGEQIMAKVTKDSMEYAGLKNLLDQQRAALALDSGSPEARAAIVKTIAQVRGVLGPDAWIQALFTIETIANTARRAGDWELARIATENMLDHDPAYGGTHYAVALLAEHQGDKAKMASALARARELWAKADKDFPEGRDIARRLSNAS